MASPRRVDVDDFFQQLSDVQRPHLDLLRELSNGADPRIEEVLKWNQPAYYIGTKGQWMLQAYKQHCSLRFGTRYFGSRIAEVETAGYFAGEGFIKLPYDQPVPVELCKRLIRGCIEDFDATGLGW